MWKTCSKRRITGLLRTPRRCITPTARCQPAHRGFRALPSRGTATRRHHRGSGAPPHPALGRVQRHGGRGSRRSSATEDSAQHGARACRRRVAGEGMTTPAPEGARCPPARPARRPEPRRRRLPHRSRAVSQGVACGAHRCRPHRCSWRYRRAAAFAVRAPLLVTVKTGASPRCGPILDSGTTTPGEWDREWHTAERLTRPMAQWCATRELKLWASSAGEGWGPCSYRSSGSTRKDLCSVSGVTARKSLRSSVRTSLVS